MMIEQLYLSDTGLAYLHNLHNPVDVFNESSVSSRAAVHDPRDGGVHGTLYRGRYLHRGVGPQCRSRRIERVGCAGQVSLDT